MVLELVLAGVTLLALVLAANCYWLARRWSHDCAECRIIIARKGRVQLDAPLVEWLAWNRALPRRERDRGGIIFQANGIQVALARPKIGAVAATTETRKVKDPGGPAPGRNVEAVRG